MLLAAYQGHPHFLVAENVRRHDSGAAHVERGKDAHLADARARRRLTLKNSYRCCLGIRWIFMKPIALCNIGSFYDDLVAMLKTATCPEE